MARENYVMIRMNKKEIDALDKLANYFSRSRADTVRVLVNEVHQKITQPQPQPQPHQEVPA